MEYKETVSISGMSGLYQLLSSKSDGAIVRSLEDNNTKFVSSRMHKITPLESIEIFTTGENVTLAKIFEAMQQKETTAPPPFDNNNDPKKLKEYFDKVFPDMDSEKVYTSDKKKMVKWYAILKANNLLKFEKEKPIEEKIVAAENETAHVEEPSKPEEKKAKSKTRKKKE